jgi:hypothetical protein
MQALDLEERSALECAELAAGSSSVRPAGNRVHAHLAVDRASAQGGHRRRSGAHRLPGPSAGSVSAGLLVRLAFCPERVGAGDELLVGSCLMRPAASSPSDCGGTGRGRHTRLEELDGARRQELAQRAAEVYESVKGHADAPYGGVGPARSRIG